MNVRLVKRQQEQPKPQPVHIAPVVVVQGWVKEFKQQKQQAPSATSTFHKLFDSNEKERA